MKFKSELIHPLIEIVPIPADSFNNLEELTTFVAEKGTPGKRVLMMSSKALDKYKKLLGEDDNN